MQIADWNDRPRAAFVRQTLDGSNPALMDRLSDRFLVRVFRFSSASSRLSSEDELTFAGAQTRLGAALDGARQELAGLPVAGLVVVTDGADTSGAALAESLRSLKAAGVPVSTVGVGRETPARDIQIGRIAAPRTALKDSALVIDVVIAQTGFTGETVTLEVEDEGRIVGSQEVTLGEPAAARVRFTATDAGPRVFRFRVAPRPGELLTENNVREAIVDVRDRREKILYFEGEPRFELKFIRRAFDEDRNIQVVAFERTADNKYLRLGVEDPDELVGGFPKTREELFQYRGLILGSVEAGAFTGDQLRMIAEFVDRRGGGLLMLGGHRAFAEGGYAGTPLEEVLPVVLARPARAAEPEVAKLQVKPTPAGAAHPVTQIARTEAASAARWNELPVVTSVNAIREVKPGATVLLTGVDERGRSQVVLASQRYGRGKAIAFTVQNSWPWQLDAKMAVDDQTHENFWRQLLRWLVDGVPDAVEARAAADRVEPGDPVALTAQIVDKAFVDLNDARVVARVTQPDGAVREVPMQWTGERSGEYRAGFVAEQPGRYEASVEAGRGDQPLESAVVHVRAAPGDAEYFDASMQAPLLRRIADETGGRFYTPDTVASLPDDLKYTSRGVTTIEERELWHMPIVLLLLAGLMCAEWGYRRAVGLA
jgi:uncharacterized membrane protein